MIFSAAFLWMKSFVFWLKFHWSLFLPVPLTITSTGLDNGLAPNRRQAIIWANADPIHWRIYAALGGDELKKDWLLKGNRPTWLTHGGVIRFYWPVTGTSHWWLIMQKRRNASVIAMELRLLCIKPWILNHLNSPTILLCSTIVQANNKRSPKAVHYWHFSC